MTIREKKQWLTGRLEEGGVEDAGYEAMLLVEMVYGMDRTAQLIHSQKKTPSWRSCFPAGWRGSPFNICWDNGSLWGCPFCLAKTP